MRIPEYAIDQLREQASIVDIVGESVPLRRRGHNWIGLCPFHNEKTPSFNVNPQTGIFKCFGCGKGGNVFTFLMEARGMTFVEAVKTVADKVGFTLPESDQGDQPTEEDKQRQAVLEALTFASDWFVRQFRSAAGSEARQYTEGRRFLPEVLDTFAIGYSPEDRYALSSALLQAGFSEQTAVDAGLAVRTDDGALIDRYRGRLIFPIHSSWGRVIGFGGRIMKSHLKLAKYINSPQTAVYDKSRVLYGLFQAKAEIRKKDAALLVEGYADVVSLWQSGFRNVIASSGTSLTKEQLELLKKYTSTLYCLFDGDSAGAAATMRSIDLAVEADFTVRVVELPEGEDPDSLVRDRGASALERLIQGAASFLAFKKQYLERRGGMSSPESTSASVRSLLETVAKVPDDIKRDFFIRDVASLFSLDEHTVRRETDKLRRHRHQHRPDAPEAGPPGRVAPPFVAPPAEARPAGQLHRAERELFFILLTVPGALDWFRENKPLVKDDLLSPEGELVWTVVVDGIENPLTEDDRQVAELIADLAVRKETVSDNWTKFDVQIKRNDFKFLQDCTRSIVLERARRTQKQVMDRLAAGDTDAELLPQLLLLQQRIKELTEGFHK